jgi:hexosaminidase
MKHIECDLTSLDDLPSDKMIDGIKVENLLIPSNLAGLDAFALTFEGLLNLKAEGMYTFYTSSDDCSRIFIDEKLVADNDGVHALLTASVKIGLQKGFHKFRLEYFEARYGEELLVEIEGPGIERQELTQDFFYIK